MTPSANYWLGMDLSEVLPGLDPKIVQTIDNSLAAPSDLSICAGFKKEAFHPDGTPIDRDVNTLYPVYAPRYLGTPIPEAFSRIEEGYSRTASMSAISRAMAFCDGAYGNVPPRQNYVGERCNGIRMDFIYADTKIAICFPVGGLTAMNEAVVIPVADTFRNDAEWGQGAIPYHVEQQARFLLWCFKECHNRLGNTPYPQKAIIARIIGNLPTDTTFYTVYEDEAKDQRLADRVFSAFLKARAAGKDPYLNQRIIPEIPWQERKELELQDAYRTDATLLYEMAKQYMLARSTRKELEAKDKALKAKADAIAISLASMTSGSEAGGTLVVGDTKYTVSHTPSRPMQANITPPLIYQFAPTHAGTVLTEKSRKISVSVDVL